MSPSPGAVHLLSRLSPLPARPPSGYTERMTSSLLLEATITHLWNGQPATPAEAVALRLARSPHALTVWFRAPWHGDPSPPGPTGSCEGLWDYEVVELFIAHGTEYTELELGPHGHHLLLRLRGVRQSWQRGLPVGAAVRREGRHWEVHAELPLALLPPEPWTFNAYAIHGSGAARRYLALHAVPGAEPDFHRLDCFPALSAQVPNSQASW